jgi:hypothetical protein
MSDEQPKCQMTMSDQGRNAVNGCENFWECEKPAKFTMISNLRGTLHVCGLHAHHERKRALKYGLPLPKKL